MSDVLGFIAAIVVLATLVFGGLFWFVDHMGQRSCSIYQEMSGTQTQWMTLDECYLKTPTGWMPYSEYVRRATTQEKH